ncbi:hypothetical protein PAPYR_12711 [Paratrimastix pyriformis]|uniref:Uncharacterized protein n=1 Tax=Paratrimastix pyriformis TaxID=342808 RepID=A0ABQ8U1E8_9EUKA|nr:hypothetical protein PAPYR_12711 [Paratrimastix pyriformis]
MEGSSNLLVLPSDLLLCIVETSDRHSLQTYLQLLSLSHVIRLAVRGNPRTLSFDDDAPESRPTADALAAIIGPCIGLTKLSFCPSGSDIYQNAYRCGLTEVSYAGWVDEAFGGHDRLTVLKYLPTTFEPAIERILHHLPGLLKLRLGSEARVSTHLLAAIAGSCPHLQALRVEGNSAILDVTALAPLAGSLQQFRCPHIPPSASLDAFVSSLSAVRTLHISRCPPAALAPLASQLTCLSMEMTGDNEARLPGPWLSRLERLSLWGQPPISAPLARLLAANQTTLRRVGLEVVRLERASGFSILMAALGALPHLTHLELTCSELPRDADVTALPPEMLSRLERLVLRVAAQDASIPPPPPRVLRITSGRLKFLCLQALANLTALSLDCPVLAELLLPAYPLEQLTVNCPRPRRLIGDMHRLAPMPGLDCVRVPLCNPVWLPDLLAGAPRLRRIHVKLAQMDLCQRLCACESLVDIRLDVTVTQLPNPLILRLPGRLESLELSFSGALMPLDLQVEAPSLRRLDLRSSDMGARLSCRLACPALTALRILLAGSDITFLELAERTRPRSLTIAGSWDTARLVEMLDRQGGLLHHLELFSLVVAPSAWPQLAAALGRLPRLASLGLPIGRVPPLLSLACPKLRNLTVVVSGTEKVVLACPLLETLNGIRDPSRQLVLAVPAPNLPRWAVDGKYPDHFSGELTY